MSSGLEKLKINSWFKALVVLSGTVLIASLLAGLFGVATMAFGFVLIGFGEWINYPATSVIQRDRAFTYSTRKPNFIGIATQVIGLLVVIYGAYRLVLS